MHIPHNLPLQLTSFIGRQRELTEIERLLHTHRLVTLAGVGGCGKTRLAVQVASVIHAADTPQAALSVDQSLFMDGVWFVELAAISSPADVPQALAAALNVHEQVGQPVVETVLSSLRRKAALLVLDNCEHLVDVCAQTAESLLRSCPGVRILATSREALGVAGELVWSTPPLAVPEYDWGTGEQQQPAAALALYDAIRLFVERAAAVQPSFVLTEQNMVAVAKVCRTLDGIPLAIEMAAARAKVLAVEQIDSLLAASLGARFRVLAAGSRTVSPRHQTLLAAIEWSYGLLSEEEQVLLRRLAIFTGSFTLDAVETVCLGNALDLLTRLVDKSLVIVEPQHHQMARYRLLETIRQFAYEKLLLAGEAERLHGDHLVFYCRLTEALEPKLRGHEQDLALERIEADYDNLRAALTWSLNDGDGVDGLHQQHGARLAGALAWFWLVRTRFDEGRHWFERALATRAAAEPTATRARVLLGSGVMAQMQCDFAHARLRLQEGFLLMQELNDLRGTAYALVWLGLTASVPGDYLTARPLIERSVELARDVGDPWLIATSARELGGTLVKVGDYSAAQPLLEESVMHFEAIGEVNGLADALNEQGYLALALGDMDSARDLMEKMLKVVATRHFLDDKYFRVCAYGALGMVARRANDNQDARDLFEAMLRVAQDMGNSWFAAIAYQQLGWLALVRGDIEQAMAYFRLSLEAYTGMTPADRLLSLSGAMLVSVDLEHWERAAVLDAAAEPLRVALQSPLNLIQEADLAQVTEAVRNLRNDPAYAEARARGQAMTLAEAVAYAIAPMPTSRPAKLAIVGEAEPELQLYALGPMRVYRGDHLIASFEWTYAKSRELLFYLLCHPPRTKEQIGLVFWPDASPGQLRNSFGVTLYHLRQALGRPGWIVFDDGRYTFNRTLPAYCDLHDFEANLAKARACLPNAPAKAIHHLQQAVACNQGDFLEDCAASDWWQLKRQQIHRQYLEALLTIGSMQFQAGDYSRAADAYRQAIERDPLLEEAHHELIRCYARLGERSEALHHYDLLNKLMLDELDLPPAEETTSLVAALRRGEDL